MGWLAVADVAADLASFNNALTWMAWRGMVVLGPSVNELVNVLRHPEVAAPLVDHSQLADEQKANAILFAATFAHFRDEGFNSCNHVAENAGKLFARSMALDFALRGSVVNEPR